MSAFWIAAIGLGMAFHGLLILWVAGVPLTFRGKLPVAEKGTPEAFGIFWIEQYRFMGFTLAVIGAAMAAWGYLS